MGRKLFHGPENPLRLEGSRGETSRLREIHKRVMLIVVPGKQTKLADTVMDRFS